jgi:hypothetical protein
MNGSNFNPSGVFWMLSKRKGESTMIEPETTATPWDGVPPNSDKTGWHWLKRKSDGHIGPWEWSDEAGAPGEFEWSTDGEYYVDDMAARFEYVGPCIPPKQAWIITKPDGRCPECGAPQFWHRVTCKTGKESGHPFD